MTFGFSADDQLLHIAVVLVAGIIGGELVGRARLPKVTGWIATGILLRSTEPYHARFTGLDVQAVEQLGPFVSLVLGYIAFTVGAALHLRTLRNAGRRLGLLLLSEAAFTPLLVLLMLGIVGVWLQPGDMSLRAAALLAVIAVAGAPGTTVLVVQEARARGILTRTLLAAVALIDVVAVGSFAFATSFLAAQGGGSSPSAWQAAFTNMGRELGIALAVGTSSALVALVLTPNIVGPAFLGPTMVAIILASWGAAAGFGVSGILACTFAGIAVSNLRHETVRSTEAYLHSAGGVLFAAFYTLAGMKLDFSLVLQAAGLVLLYFLARFLGKYLGAFTAMSAARAPREVRLYLGLALLPHGGVAVGLILLVQADPRLTDVAEIVTTVGLATLALNQLLGPSGARLALHRAGEAGQGHPRLLDFLGENHIQVNVSGTTKEQIVTELAARLYATPKRPTIPRDELVQRILAREEEESTCLGEGFMLPHVLLEEGTEMTGVLGLSRAGIPLGAPDGRAVHAILLLATPKAEQKRYLQVLAAFATAIVRDVNLREQLYYARTAAHAYNILHAAGATDINYFMEDAFDEAELRAPDR